MRARTQLSIGKQALVMLMVLALLLSGCSGQQDPPQGFATPEEAARNSLTDNTTQQLQLSNILPWGDDRIALFSKVDVHPTSGKPQAEVFGYLTLHRNQAGWGGFMSFAFGRQHPPYGDDLLSFGTNLYDGGGSLLQNHFAVYGYTTNLEASAVEAQLQDGRSHQVAIMNGVFIFMLDPGEVVCTIVALDQQRNVLQKYHLQGHNGNPLCLSTS